MIIVKIIYIGIIGRKLATIIGDYLKSKVPVTIVEVTFGQDPKTLSSTLRFPRYAVALLGNHFLP